MRKYSILIVDDEELVRATVSLDLKEMGFETLLAANGTEAVELLKHRKFDLNITDLMMEGLTGLDVLREAKRVHANALVLILTGYGTLDSAVQAMRLGAVDYLLKPARREELKIRVTHCLQKLELLNTVEFYERVLNICPLCNRIREAESEGQKQEWVNFEVYLGRKTDMDLSHGYCPTCLSKAFDEVQDVKRKIMTARKPKENSPHPPDP